MKEQQRSVRVWTLGKVWEDLSLEATAVGLRGGRRLWRKESVFRTFRKNCEKYLLYEKPKNYVARMPEIKNGKLGLYGKV